MEYNTLNFKLFITDLQNVIKFNASLILLWIKDTLLYSKRVLNIKLFCLKVISSSILESGIHDLPPKFGPFSVFLLTLNGIVSHAFT